ncbi:HD family phosphohydrolase [Methylacidiphilum caldifontis]|uniref:HD domain-containing protein n=1 Tax=Methylacidiphilum caldifontis TaxID=2795386 RepID=A0A4Y8PGE4_9BACT|nr:HDIG domain-containing metalloprotein [Methylacidiphilum caldifontis]TFE71273.1 hypothetical protein A7Q10_04640 [Methylacidiphilum caldifontis]
MKPLLEHLLARFKRVQQDRKRRIFVIPKWENQLETNEPIRIAIFLFFIFFCIVLGLFATGHVTYSLVFLSLILTSCTAMVLNLSLPKIFYSNSKLLLVFAVIAINLLIAKSVYVWSIHQPGLESRAIYFYVSTAVAPLLVTALINVNAGVIVVVLSSVFISLLVNPSIPLLASNLLSGIVGVYFIQRICQRRDILKAGIAVGLTSLVCAVGFGIINGGDTDVLIQQAFLSIGIGLFTAVLINTLLPLLEEIFQLNTDFTWLELSDLNHTLLRRLAAEAPGTYHHSLMVANIAEAAANAIGENGSLCRVMAYFHDIGKVINPQYFVENQGADNPHSRLTPAMSALVIISHVKDGVDLALEHHLRRPIIDAIQQHHGTSLVYYFYRKALQNIEDCRMGVKILNMDEGDLPEIDESRFRYPGPKPQTKEIGILMLADSIESASRCLEKPSLKDIEQLVEDIVSQKLQDHQLDECPLSMKEITEIKKSFVFSLKTILHTRIHYPKNTQNVEKSSGGDSESSERGPVALIQSKEGMEISSGVHS